VVREAVMVIVAKVLGIVAFVLVLGLIHHANCYRR